METSLVTSDDLSMAAMSQMKSNRFQCGAFDYSNAQHALIASYIAEDLYGRERAQAVMASYVAEFYYRKYPKVFPHALKYAFLAFGVDLKHINCSEVQKVMNLTDAIARRDLCMDFESVEEIEGFNAKDVIIKEMEAGHAYTLLLLRYKEFLPGYFRGLKAYDKAIANSLFGECSMFGNNEDCLLEA